MNAADPHALTILRSCNTRALTKSFTIATNGLICKRDHNPVRYFAADFRIVSDIDALFALLCEQERDACACIIRGRLKADRDASRVLRRKAQADDPFEEVARSWIMLDIDGLPVNIDILDDPHFAARHLVDLVASAIPELEGVSCVVQFSSNAGLRETQEIEVAAGRKPRWSDVIKRGTSAHLWLLTTKPYGEAELKRWCDGIAKSGLPIDASTLQTVQPHYTASPIFGAPLRDPLLGKRTILVRGLRDRATLVIPEQLPSHAPPFDRVGFEDGGVGFEARLAAITGPHAIRAPVSGAIFSYIATHYPEIDTAYLKVRIRQRLAIADPGNRPGSTMSEYKSDQHLDALISWAVSQEVAKAAKREEALRQLTTPAFPDRGVSLTTATDQTHQALAEFSQRIALGETPSLLLRVTVGAGKTEAIIREAGKLLAGAREVIPGGALYVLVPRHDLSAELAERFAQAHPGLKVAIWKGLEWRSIGNPDDSMCLDPELPEAAVKAGLSATEPCKACPLHRECRYQAQGKQKADIWLLAHNFLFLQKPDGLPAAAVVVIDEAFWGTALQGVNLPVQLAVSALQDRQTSGLQLAEREILLHRRRIAHAALSQQDEGGLLKEAFAHAGMTPQGAKEWLDSEWLLKPQLRLQGCSTRQAILTEIARVAAIGFTRLRPLLAERVRDLMEGSAARDGHTELRRNCDLSRNQGTGDVVTFRSSEKFAEWVAPVPKILLDATTHPDVVRVWAPDLKLVDIEVSAPAQQVTQVPAEFGRAGFLKSESEIRKVADLVIVELAKVAGAILVVAQKDVETLLRTAIEHRLQAIPERLSFAHHGNLTGLDRHRDAELVIVIGRPAQNLLDGERLAGLIKGCAIDAVLAADKAYWPRMPAGIRRQDGTAYPIEQPHHPDPFVEAARWSITEGAVIQAIGRVRGVQRPPDRPVRVILLARLALPLTVHEVVTWEDLRPSRLAVAAAEAALLGRALPLGAADLSSARRDLWATAKAAERHLAQIIDPQSPYKYLSIRALGVYNLLLARYKKPGAKHWSRALVPRERSREALNVVLPSPAVAFELLPHAQAAAPENSGISRASGEWTRLPEAIATKPAADQPVLTERLPAAWRGAASAVGKQLPRLPP